MNLQTYVTDLRSRLRESPATQREIARLAGQEISFSWINKFATGALKNPSVDSLMALERALDQLATAKAA